MVGIGTAGFLAQSYYETSSQKERAWEGAERELFVDSGSADPYKRDQRNAAIYSNMQYIHMERQIRFETGDQPGYAGIANEPESKLSCRITLIRDGTGELLYQSKLIDPGYYIDHIQLNTKLRKGYYPCTIVWEFYGSKTDLPVGSLAGKSVVIVDG